MIGRWLACGLDSLASPGLIGAPLATVRRSEWFRWFALVETERESTSDGGEMRRFRPERGAPVELTLKLDDRERVVGMKLDIGDTFLAGRSRPFALDALKTAWVRGSGVARVAVMAPGMTPVSAQAMGDAVAAALMD